MLADKLFSAIVNSLSTPSVELSKKSYKILEKVAIDQDGKEENKQIIKDMHICILTIVNNIADRRVSVSKFFVTIHSIVLGMLGYVLNMHENIPIYIKLLSILPYIMSLFFCYIWGAILSSYASLGIILLSIAKSMEKNLPVKPMSWLSLVLDKTQKQVFDLSTLEVFFPVLFVFLYTVIFLVLLAK